MQTAQTAPAEGDRAEVTTCRRIAIFAGANRRNTTDRVAANATRVVNPVRVRAAAPALERLSRIDPSPSPGCPRSVARPRLALTCNWTVSQRRASRNMQLEVQNVVPAEPTNKPIAIAHPDRVGRALPADDLSRV